MDKQDKQFIKDLLAVPQTAETLEWKASILRDQISELQCHLDLVYDIKHYKDSAEIKELTIDNYYDIIIYLTLEPYFEDNLITAIDELKANIEVSEI